MSTLNMNSILLKVTKIKKTQALAFKKIDGIVNVQKVQLLEEFDASPVTKELLAGPDLSSSAVLPDRYGNLFSFLGFDRNKENPIVPVRKLLENIRLLRKPIVNRIKLTFILKVPRQSDFDKASPMEWESGRSWISAVTHGIGTFSHYMFSLKAGRFKSPTRSGTGIQVASDIHSTSQYLAGIGYVIGMVGKFKRKLVR